jgi:5-hydroxyisourate hydrolase
MSAITTHVLNTATGMPADGVPVTLEVWHQDWTLLASVETNADGRARLTEDAPLGRYRIVFALGADVFNVGTFYPEVAIQFIVRDTRHHHIPLLLSPFGYSTYRGS